MKKVRPKERRKINFLFADVWKVICLPAGSLINVTKNRFQKRGRPTVFNGDGKKFPCGLNYRRLGRKKSFGFEFSIYPISTARCCCFLKCVKEQNEKVFLSFVLSSSRNNALCHLVKFTLKTFLFFDYLCLFLFFLFSWKELSLLFPMSVQPQYIFINKSEKVFLSEIIWVMASFLWIYM